MKFMTVFLAAAALLILACGGQSSSSSSAKSSQPSSSTASSASSTATKALVGTWDGCGVKLTLNDDGSGTLVDDPYRTFQVTYRTLSDHDLYLKQGTVEVSHNYTVIGNSLIIDGFGTPVQSVCSLTREGTSTQPVSQTSLVGKWTAQSCVGSTTAAGQVWEFKSNGTMTQTAPGQPPLELNYELVGSDFVKMSKGAFEISFRYVISGNQMTTDPGTSRSCILKKS